MVSSVTVKNDGTVEVADDDASGTDLVSAPAAALAVELSRAREYRRHTKAEATRTAYEGSWGRFRAWAVARQFPVLPTLPEVVEAYAGWLANEGCSVSTIERFLSAGTHYHRAAGFDFPRNTAGVRETLKGIRKRIRVKHSKKSPLGLVALSSVCARLEQTAEGFRNRAMLTVGWWCMLRSANLVTILREHVRLVRFEQGETIDDNEKPEGLVLHLPVTKTDQFGKGRDVAVYAQADKFVCPVQALIDYFAAVRLAPGDLIFPVSERTVSRLIKRLVANPAHGHKSLREIANCVSCATAASRFASHSLRRGSAHKFARDGVPEREIMRHGGWTSERVARGYMDEALLFENNPTKVTGNK